MIMKNKALAIGWRVYGLGLMVLGVVCLAWDDFVLGQPVPKGLHHPAALAYAAGALMLAAGAAVQWRRTVAWGAGVLAVSYMIVVVILMNGRVILRHTREYVAYSGTAEQLAIGVGALITFAATAGISSSAAARLTRLGQILFGVCALLFGGAHFVYMNQTAPLVPKWLPPTQVFWGYATGIGFIAAGVAILTGKWGRLAAILLTAMLASFALLVHWPMLLAKPSHMNWTESGVNLAVMGAAWVVAGSLRWRGR